MRSAGGPAVTRPVWLLDVDGVLNAPRPGWRQPPGSGVAYAGGTGYLLRFAPALLDRLRQIHTDGLADIRWATTWTGNIDEVIRVMDLPAWPCAFGAVSHDAVAEAKYAAARRVVLQEGRPLIWTDDLHIPPDRGPAMRALRAAGPRVLAIRPSPRRGLQPRHLRSISAFAARAGAPGA